MTRQTLQLSCIDCKEPIRNAKMKTRRYCNDCTYQHRLESYNAANRARSAKMWFGRFSKLFNYCPYLGGSAE